MRSLIVGAARSGVALARHLTSEGQTVRVADRRPAADLQTALSQMPHGVELQLGGYDSTVLEGIDVVYASPGVPWDADLLNEARAKGIEVSSEIGLFLKLNQGTVVGITGTNGKTTTTALTGAVLSAGDRPVIVGGNIGDTVLDRVDEITPEHWVVLEGEAEVTLNDRILHLTAHQAVDVPIGATHRLRNAGSSVLRVVEVQSGAYLGEDDGQCCSRPLHGQSRGRVHGKNDVQWQPRELGREGVEGGLPRGRPPVLDRDIFCFSPPVIA